MKPLTDDSLMARSLARLTRAVISRRRFFFYSQGILFLFCIWYTAFSPWHLQFDPSRDNLVGGNKKYHQNYLRFKTEFPQQDDLVVVAESDNPEKNRQFVERLGAKLEAETNLFTDVLYKGDLKMMGNKALLFVPDSGPATLSGGDLKDLSSLAAKLRRPSDPVSTFLRDRLSPATQQVLENSQGAGADTALLLTDLTNDLNTIIGGPSIFETQRFAGVALRRETQRHLAENPVADPLARLNRLLIEDAYPQEVSRSDLEELLRTLQTFRPFIEQFTRATNLVSLFDLVNTQFRTARREKSEGTDSLIKALPALERIISQADASLKRPGAPPSPGVAALFDAGEEAEQQEYITFANGRIYMVNAHALREDLNDKAVERLRELTDETKMEVPGLNAGITGEPVLDYDEMHQSQKDTTIASIASLVICALIFIYGYHETGRPIKATICLVVGLAYTLAFATLVIGHLNILTITFVPMLIGLAIDFGVHLITRYEEELSYGRTEEAALTKAMVYTGQGIFTGAFTTAGAFLAMAFTHFKGIQEMGVICGGGLLICVVPMMTLLPVMLLRGRQNVIDHQRGLALERRAQIENIWLRRPATVAAVTAVLCALSLSQFRKVHFDYNLLHMQSAGLPAVQLEEKLIRSASKSVLFCAVIADSLSEATNLEARIKTLPSVEGVDSVGQFLTEDAAGKLRLIGEIKRELAPIRFGRPDSRPVNIPQLSLSLYGLFGYAGNALEDIGTNEPALARQFVSLRGTIENFRKDMLAGDDTRQEAKSQKLAEFQLALFGDVRETFEILKNQDDSAPLRAEDLPKALRDRFIGVTGQYLLQVYPKKDIWRRDNQEEFILELRHALDPNQTNHPVITGTPVQLYEYTTLLKDSYEQAARYSLAAIALLVFFHFRSIASVVLALLPVAIGSIWLGGLMGAFNIPLNPANIMTLPLVIGIGVTNGIHILNRFAEEQTASILSKSTGKAVFVSGLTAIAGFGSLILAKHRGIQSLGYVMSMGIATCMIAGLTFLPALLNLIYRNRQPIEEPSADNAMIDTGSGGTEAKPKIQAEINGK